MRDGEKYKGRFIRKTQWFRAFLDSVAGGFVQNALSKIVCFLHRCGPCVGNVFGSILEQISADFESFFGVGKGILERLLEVVCEGRVLSWILKFWGGGWEPKWEKTLLG